MTGLLSSGDGNLGLADAGPLGMCVAGGRGRKREAIKAKGLPCLGL
jgi:hypothetical protein